MDEAQSIKDRPQIPNKEVAPSRDSLNKDQIAASAVRFASFISQKYPQTETQDGSQEEMLSYSFAGSLATMLLSRVNSFTAIDGEQLPRVVRKEERQIPEEAREILATFARPMGDLDFVKTSYYDARLQKANHLLSTSPEEYARERNKILTKGGGGPSFDEVPEEAKQALAMGEGQVKLMCDPVSTLGSEGVAEITIDGNKYYIARPDHMIAYKVLHLLQSYDKKPDKFNSDFGKLLQAVKTMYSEEDLVNVTEEVLDQYDNSLKKVSETFEQPFEPKIPEMINKVLDNENASPEIRNFLGKISTQIVSVSS